MTLRNALSVDIEDWFCVQNLSDVGFRAPCVTIVEQTKWALPILEKHQTKYDSSIVPIGFHPDQPRVKLPLAKHIRHYYGLKRTERKLERLLTDFRFTTIRNVLGL